MYGSFSVWFTAAVHKEVDTMHKSLIQKLGLLGVVSFLSYTAAVVFAPLAYPGYN